MEKEKKVFREEIQPLLTSIKKICNTEQIPFFATFALCSSSDNPDYETECLTPGVLGVNMLDDRISKMINVINGFETIPPHEIVTIKL